MDSFREMCHPLPELLLQGSSFCQSLLILIGHKWLEHGDELEQTRQEFPHSTKQQTKTTPKPKQKSNRKVHLSPSSTHWTQMLDGSTDDIIFHLKI